MHSRRRFLGVVAVGAALPFTLRAQGLETAKIIVGFPPGGTTDVMARKIAEKLRGPYARSVIVENRPGAGGQLGVTALRDSAADGVNTLKEFFAWARANPDKAAYGSPGAGSMPHLVGVLLAKAGGAELRHAAYRG